MLKAMDLATGFMGFFMGVSQKIGKLMVRLCHLQRSYFEIKAGICEMLGVLAIIDHHMCLSVYLCVVRWN